VKKDEVTRPLNTFPPVTVMIFFFENVYNILLGSHAKQHVFQSDKINRNESVLGLKHMNMQDSMYQ